MTGLVLQQPLTAVPVKKRQISLVSLSLGIMKSDATKYEFTVVHVTIRVGKYIMWCQPYVIHVKIIAF